MLYPEGATVVIEGPSTTDEAGNRVEGTVMVGRRQEDADTNWGNSSQTHGGVLPGQAYSSERYDGREEGSTGTKSKKKKKKKHREEP
jgi:hypothetical protein